MYKTLLVAIVVLIILICLIHYFVIKENYSDSGSGDQYKRVGPDSDIPWYLTGPFIWNNPTRWYNYYPFFYPYYYPFVLF